MGQWPGRPLAPGLPVYPHAHHGHSRALPVPGEPASPSRHSTTSVTAGKSAVRLGAFSPVDAVVLHGKYSSVSLSLSFFISLLSPILKLCVHSSVLLCPLSLSLFLYFCLALPESFFGLSLCPTHSLSLSSLYLPVVLYTIVSSVARPCYLFPMCLIRVVM